MTTYKRAIATAIISATLATALAACGPSTEQGPCFTPSEDAPVTCDLDPTKRYDYDGSSHSWRVVPDSLTYANGNQPPTGAELLATESSYDGRG